MAKYIKNNDTINRTWHGQEISPGAYYLIQEEERAGWANDSDLLDSICDGTAIVSKYDSSDGHILDHSDAINFLKDDMFEIDSQGRQIIRAAAGKKGWTYQARAKTITTSDLTSMYCHDWEDNVCVCCTVKFFDADDVEITDQNTADTDCVRTEVLFKPDFDYEIIGGYLRQHTRPSQNVKIWVLGGIIELGGIYIKEMVRSEDLKFLSPDCELRTDGRASKFMTKTIPGVPYQGNQVKFILRHPAGLKHEILIGFELFLE